MMKRMIAGLIIVALVSSGFTYAILRLYPGSSNSQNIGTDYQMEIQSLNSSLEQLSEAFDGLNMSLAKLSSDLNDSNETLRWDLLQTNENISTIQNNILSFQQGIAELQGQFVAMQNQLNTTENGLHNVQSQMESLSEEVSAVETDVSELSQKILVLAANATQVNEDVSTIQSDVSMLTTNMQSVQTQVASILYDLSIIEAKVSLLESRTTELENQVNALNSTDKIVVRVSFLEFTILDTLTIPPPLPADYLFDVGVYIIENGERQYPSVASARSGHSRFIRPTYVELTIRNGSEYKGEPLSIHPGDEVAVYIVAYYHLDDATLDIQPDASWGPQPIGEPWKESGSQLFILYSIGTVKSGSVNGEDDGYLTDHRDAYLQYKIETFYG
jgi:septal ring factor EnvC (AmiA/AmiB activator)